LYEISSNNLFSGRGLFLFFVGVFWFLTIVSSTPWGAWTFYVLYWLPTPLEFGALMLLPFYFAQVIYSDGWKWHWGRWVQIAYTCFMLGLIILQAVWAVVEAIQKVTLSLLELQ